MVNIQHIVELKFNQLHPGVQVSDDCFESLLLGHAFDSLGKASADTFNCRSIFVDNCTGCPNTNLGFRR